MELMINKKIKNKLLLIVLILLVLLVLTQNSYASFMGREIIVNDLNDVEETIEIGNQIIKAVKDYKIKYGNYPEKLEGLVPEYFAEVPKTKMKKLDRDNYNRKCSIYIGNLDMVLETASLE